MFYKFGDTKNDRVSGRQEYKTTQSLELAISNGTTALENDANDQLNLQDATNNFNKSTRSSLPEKEDEKEVTLKNSTESLKGRKLVINGFERGIFPKRTANVFDDGYHHAYDDELRSEGT